MMRGCTSCLFYCVACLCGRIHREIEQTSLCVNSAGVAAPVPSKYLVLNVWLLQPKRQLNEIVVEFMSELELGGIWKENEANSK